MTKYSTLRTANAARQKEWDKAGGIDAAYRANELAGEMGEACNVIKKLERERLGIRGSRETTAHLAEELSDVIICVDLIAMQQNVPVTVSSGYPVGFKSAAAAGAELAKQVGRLCDCILHETLSSFELRCLLVVRTTYGIAALYGIDLDAAVAAKFNATSEKVGLATRLASKMAEAT